MAVLDTLLAPAPMALQEFREEVLLLEHLRRAVPSTQLPYLPSSATVAEDPITWPGSLLSFVDGLRKEFSLYLCRDCLAAPGTFMNDVPTGPAAGNLNKSKTCYKCQQEGHVSDNLLHLRDSLTYCPSADCSRLP